MRTLDPRNVVKARAGLRWRFPFPRPDALTPVDFDEAIADALRAGDVKNLPDAEGVYLFVNRETGRVYVGRSNRIRVRCARHLAEIRLGNCTKTQVLHDYIDHGLDSFRFAVLTLTDPAWTTLCERSAINLAAERDFYNVVGAKDYTGRANFDTGIAARAPH